jgi:ABC-type branched-subunit amino acid transport system ATPase component
LNITENCFHSLWAMALVEESPRATGRISDHALVLQLGSCLLSLDPDALICKPLGAGGG